jgi:hypothetical protein
MRLGSSHSRRATGTDELVMEKKAVKIFLVLFFKKEQGFFFEKKKQKTFDYFGQGLLPL